MKPVRPGIEILIEDPPSSLQGKRLGLLTNAAATNRELEPSAVLINHHFRKQLKALFSPQHGFFGDKQDNMVASHDFVHPTLDIPVYSLYGAIRSPTPSMLEGIDMLLVDLQDVGARVYTFVYTLALCMEAARSCGKEVLVLDRPNPLGGIRIEGNCLRPEHTSFVGMYPIPMRHGLTIGELARLFNNHFSIRCKLAIVPMAGWTRGMLFQDTLLPWIAPSPNMPTPNTTLVYPGQVLWEGTNLSEGRGTTQPFELFGAPFLDLVRLQERLGPWSMPGVCLRPVAFEPMYSKWQGQVCHGFQLHVTEPDRYMPYRTTLALLQAVSSAHPGRFKWKEPPYEYERTRLPFDVITGDPMVRRAVDEMTSLDELEEGWQDDLETFEGLRRDYFLYE